MKLEDEAVLKTQQVGEKMKKNRMNSQRLVTMEEAA